MDRSILRTVDEVSAWFQPKPKTLAFDWETTGLNYLQMDAVGISFCDGKRVCYVDLTQDNRGNLLVVLADCFSNPDGLYIAHSLKFDLKCCHKFCGITPKNLFDTYVAAMVLDENRETYKLKVLVQTDLHVPAKEVAKWQEAAAAGYGSDVWYNYCFNDSIWAFGLYQLYAPQLKKQDLEYLFYQVEMPFVPVLAYMERTGVSIDKPKLLQLQQSLEARITGLEDEMLALCKLKPTVQLTFGGSERKLPINFNSQKQMIRLLEGFGLQVPINKAKKKSIDKKLIDPLRGKHPFVDLYLEYKMLTKLHSSYVLPAWELIDADGRIRPSFGSARTGRLTCSHPNLQNLPRPSKKYPELNYRSIMKAVEGCSLLAPDYSGQELRLLGVVADDKVIQNAFLEGLDLHLLTANECFSLNLSTEQMTEDTPEFKKAKDKYAEQRYKAKNGANFPIIYGTTAHGVSWRQGVSVEEAQRWIDSFFRLYPDVRRAMDDTERELQERGFVTTLFGRRRRFPGFQYLNPREKASALRQAFNFKVQGSAADQVKIAMSKIFTAGYSVVLMVHDEVVIEIATEDAEVAGEKIKSLMENAVSFCIPFKVEYKIASNYGSLK